MEIRIERKGKAIKTDYLKINIGEKAFRIAQEGDFLVINKADFKENNLKIYPVVANEIRIE